MQEVDVETGSYCFFNEWIEVPETPSDITSAEFGTLRDYMPGACFAGEDIVRTAWRHAEAGRNDLPGSQGNLGAGNRMSVPIWCGRRSIDGI